MKRITITILALVAIIIAVASRRNEQPIVRSVEATETTVSTTVRITQGKEVTPVKSTVSSDFTKSGTKPITEVTTSIKSEIEITTEPKPETKQAVLTTKQIEEVTTPPKSTTSIVTTKPAETTATEVSTKPIETTTNVTTSVSEIEVAPDSEDDIPKYKPSIGGDNPLDNPNDITEIDDRPVEDYVGDNENRPGEGLHF